MLSLRSWLFNLTYFGWLLICSAAYVPLMLILPKKAFASFCSWPCAVIGWFARVIVGIHVKVEGTENIPDTPFIVASKHQSAMETLLFFTMVPRPVYILKRELFLIPFFGWVLAKMGCVGIDRSAGASALKKMLKGCQAALKDGSRVIIFPEGTRTAPGIRHKYQPGVVMLYKNCDVPLVPVALNTGYVWGRKAWIKKPGTVTFKFLPPIEKGLDKKTFMAKLETEIETACTEIGDADMH